MKTKTLIILITIIVLGIGGFFVYPNIFDSEKEILKENVSDTPINKICLKISQPDDIYYCLAVANQDKSFCQNLNELDQKKLCQGMATRDVSYCREIQENGAKKMCYYELSFLTGEFDYCDEAEDPDECYFAFIHRLHWESRNDEIKSEYCQKINDNTPEGLIFKNCCLAFKEQDSTLCQENKYCLSYFEQPLSFCETEFETPEGKFKYRDDCLIDRAMSEKDSSICADIKEEELRDLCYGNFSTHISPDISLCEKIIDEMARNMCYAELAIHLGRISKDSQELTNKAQACIDSGGTISTGLCCQLTDGFPNTCLIGACGCAPEYSHEVKICDCGEDKCFDGEKCATRIQGEIKKPEEQKETLEISSEIPPAYHIKNPPYYREDGFCWGASAIMLMMDYGLTKNEVQEFRDILKSGPGGPPDMFRGFREFGVLDKIRTAYLRDYNKQFADFYNHQLLANPREQVVILNNKNEALKKIKELISADILVSIMGHHGNHYMIVTGYDEDYIYINDPGIDNVFLEKVDYQTKYEQKTKMLIDDFFEQWTISDFEGGGIGFPGDCGMIWLAD